MIIQTMCDHCHEWINPRDTELCVDCARTYCTACGMETGHTLAHQDARAEEREYAPDGWYYLRCKDTPYDIHEAS